MPKSKVRKKTDAPLRTQPSTPSRALAPGPSWYPIVMAVVLVLGLAYMVVYYLTNSRTVPLPTPPSMRNHGNYTASICEIVRWLGEKAEAAGINIFTGYPVDALLVDEQRVIGVRTTPTGLKRDGTEGAVQGTVWISSVGRRD